MSDKKPWREQWREKLKEYRQIGNGGIKREEIEAFLAEAKESCNSNDPRKMSKSIFYANRLMCSWVYSLDKRVEGWETMLMLFMETIEEHFDNAQGFNRGFWKAFGIIGGIVTLLIVLLGGIAALFGAVKIGG